MAEYFRRGDNQRRMPPRQPARIPNKSQRDLIKGQPELALRMLSSLALHLRVLVGQIEDISLKDVETQWRIGF